VLPVLFGSPIKLLLGLVSQRISLALNAMTAAIQSVSIYHRGVTPKLCVDTGHRFIDVFVVPLHCRCLAPLYNARVGQIISGTSPQLIDTTSLNSEKSYE